MLARLLASLFQSWRPIFVTRNVETIEGEWKRGPLMIRTVRGKDEFRRMTDDELAVFLRETPF